MGLCVLEGQGYKDGYDTGFGSKVFIELATGLSSNGTYDVRSKVANYQDLSVENFFFRNITTSHYGHTQNSLYDVSQGQSSNSYFGGSAVVRINDYNATTGVVSYTLSASTSAYEIMTGRRNGDTQASITADLCCFGKVSG